MCGLKLFCLSKRHKCSEVTPHVGVWIETVDASHDIFVTTVTPHVGVWIETGRCKLPDADHDVTPHVGVWIETSVG